MLVCTICRSQQRPEIDAALVAGDSLRGVAKRFGVSAAAVFRHKRDHLASRIAKAQAAVERAVQRKVDAVVVAEFKEGSSLLDRLKSLNQETIAILQEAREKRDNYTALSAIARVEKQLEIEAKLLGAIDEGTKIAFGVQVNTHAPTNNLDLSKLSGEEYETLRALVLKAQPTLQITGGQNGN